MSDNISFDNKSAKPKSFWQRPEGITGAIFLIAIVGGLGYLIFSNLDVLIGLAQNTIYLAIMILIIAAILYMVLDPRMRNLIWYMYKSVMRRITGLFVKVDPIGILKSYIEDMEKNVTKLREQIGNIRGQMRRLSGLVEENNADIENNMKLASAAKEAGKDEQMILASRKAARLKESNEKYSQLHSKLEVLYRILSKMHTNSEILLEDTKDQVKLKEQERKAINASHSAMESARRAISGDPDRKAMFDAAMENIAEDVANKVGEMEQFMEMSADFMEKIDLQQGIFEEEGLKMLEEWEQKSSLMLLNEGDRKKSNTLDLDTFENRPEKQEKKDEGSSSYDSFFSN